MKLHTLIIAVFVSFCITTGYSQERANAKGAVPKQRLGIVNGMATYLPRPEYTKEARDFCAKGKVEVEVLVDKHGKVISANAISGDEILYATSVAAARKAIFQNRIGLPVKRTGLLVYNFDQVSKCVVAGVVNEKAISIPKPLIGAIIHPSHLRLKEDEIVNVIIVINEAGNVISARATSGHPLLRNVFERSAAGARFQPALANPGGIRVKAILSYKIKLNGEIEY